MSFDHQKAFADISLGNADALQCLNTLFEWFHMLDDLIDRDRPANVPWTIICHLRVLECVASNPFFQKYKLVLLPVLQASSLAYIDSDRFTKRDAVLQRLGSQVLKSQYQDVFYAVARIVGGDIHMLQMSEKYRDFDYDPVPPPQP